MGTPCLYHLGTPCSTGLPQCPLKRDRETSKVFRSLFSGHHEKRPRDLRDCLYHSDRATGLLSLGLFSVDTMKRDLETLKTVSITGDLEDFLHHSDRAFSITVSTAFSRSLFSGHNEKRPRDLEDFLHHSDRATGLLSLGLFSVDTMKRDLQTLKTFSITVIELSLSQYPLKYYPPKTHEIAIPVFLGTH